ncbi:aminotransferase-like domain-containing protein [Actinoallomurus soli]|uniref:aminotransferase-like domain-containing protein n=1 Tax=Actinoallomurus soli TaxID=2952535 RepID=UPI0020927886|nr:PLP-dependent aminotransferase family protein [Actinoallomurus soli]MCO5967359.1 PLP-dependent aminotransferase family protein [Actinoallomurus soli]
MERGVVALLGNWPAGRGPLYQRLADAVRRAVEDGLLHPGDRMPSERRLADALRVSRTTVVGAYDRLRSDGLLVSRRGSGTRIAATARPHRRVMDRRVPGGTATAVFQRLIDGPDQVISLTTTVEGAVPELEEVLRDLAAEDLTDLLADPGYHPCGLPELRTVLAERMTRDGLPTVADEILVTTGAHQAIALVADLYLGSGGTVLVETPNWPGCLDVFRARGARLRMVPVDDEGADADAVAAALAAGSPRLLYVMPTYHNPTGVLMSAARRRRIAELAARHDVPVLEDNAYVRYEESAEPLRPLAGYAPPGAEVLSVGSLAKTVWAGLRIGWVRAPAEVVQRLARRKVLADIAGPVLDQALAARLVPRLEEITRARAPELARRLDHVEALLRDRLPRWRWRRPDGGGALWIELPGVDADTFAQVALRHGVEVVPGSVMDPGRAHDSHIRVPFTLPRERLDVLVHRLARAWAEIERDGPVAARDGGGTERGGPIVA